MSILTRIEDRGLAAKTRAEKINKGIAHANRVLTESSLGARCPNLLADLNNEGTSKEAMYKAATLVQIMENTAAYVLDRDGRDLLKEDASAAASTTAQSLLSPGVASLTPKVLDIVNVFYPSMVANYIADIQALDRQSGQIFTIKTLYSQTASGVEAGDIIFEKPTDGTYSSEFVGYGAGETLAADVTLNPTTNLDDATVKIRAGSFIVRVAGKEVARDYGNGYNKSTDPTDKKTAGAELVGVVPAANTYGVFGKGVSGTVDPQTGVATLKFDASLYADAIAAGAVVTAEAAVDTEVDTDLIKKIQFEIPNQPVLAKEHPLMSSYSVAAGLVMNAHLAIDTDELISNQLAGTIRWERDLSLIQTVYAGARKEAALTFDCAANGANLTLQQRYSSYTTTVSSARGIIQERAGRGTVEFIICSATQGLPVIEQIEGFKAAPEAKKPIGPYLAGTLREGTISVIAVPYSKTLPEDQVVFGFKGFQLGDSAIVLAEWVALYFTPTFQAPNLRNHRGCLSFYDLFLNKPEYLVAGAIANFNQA